MSRENKNAPGDGASLAQRRAAVDTDNLTTNDKPLSSTLKSAFVLHHDLLSFYLARCEAVAASNAEYLSSYSGLCKALDCAGSVLNKMAGVSDG